MKRHLVCVLTLFAACGLEATEKPIEVDAPTESPLFVDPPKLMTVVAHQDDDLSLLLPDTMHTMRTQPLAKLRGVVLTSGDADFACHTPSGAACNDDYVKGRETGQLAALAAITNVPINQSNPEAAWSSSWLTLSNGKHVRVRTSNDNRVSVVYLGLPNGAAAVLSQLWDGSDGNYKISTLDCDTRRVSPGMPGKIVIDTYTRAELIDTLRILMEDYQPAQINTLDASRLWPPSYPFDHSDHIASALFVLSASQKYSRPHSLRMYRTYNTLFENENVSPDEAALKLQFLQIYGEWDAWFPNVKNDHCPTGTVTICDRTDVCQDPDLFWGGLEYRQHTIAPVQGTGMSGGIRSPLGTCMRAASAVSGAAVTLANCDFATAGLEWLLQADGTIRPKAAANLCVTATFPANAYRPRNIGLTLSACSAPGTALAFNQQFMLFSGGQLRGPDATCVAANNNALSITECADNANQQGFVVQFFPAPSTAATAGFSETANEVPNRYDIYHSISYGDLDGSAAKLADVCVRRTDGVYCSKSTGTGFGPASRFTTEFRDAVGWGSDPYGSTVQLADVNNDKKADICGRGGAGILCGLGTGTSFGPVTTWSNGIDFSDLALYNGNVSNYGSLHFPDVNNDGFADVCARNASGIECALNKKGTLKAFNPVKQWISTEFTNTLLWNDAAHGSTIQFADVDGDKLVDVCGRGAYGILCALNDGQEHFVQPRLWSETNDFSDQNGWDAARSRYGSVHFGDLNGDGRADVCGRSPNGIMCGISMGSSFSNAKLMIPVNPFDDAGGWNPDRYGSTFALADVDGDGHVDACARGPIPGAGIGLRCAFAP